MARHKTRQYLALVDSSPALTAVGSKAEQLQHLIRLGLRVPRTYVVSWEAYERYLQDDPGLVEELHFQLIAMLDPDRLYAVRSSANLEDRLEHSFAGQFKTVLEAQGEKAVLLAIWSIWATAQAASVQTYLDKLPAEKRQLRMGIIVQEMVTPVLAGVAFSRNPVNGDDEVIVEAVEGSGVVLVQQGATPLRWVHQESGWKAAPNESPVQTSLIEQIIQQTRQVAAAFKMDVDLEWVYDGQELFWVQMREITSLKQMTIYSNRIAREVLPGMIKPLVWSINVPLINSVWVKVLTELVGQNDLKFDDLARCFYYRAYFNLSALGRIWAILGMPRESLEMIMGVLPRAADGMRFQPTWRMLRLAPRLLSFLWQKWRLGRRFESEYPRLQALFTTYDWQQASQLSEAELLTAIDRLYQDLPQLVYYNINIPILSAFYNALLGRVLKRAGGDIARLDLMAGFTEHLAYAPEVHLQALQQEFTRLDPALQAIILRSSYDEFMNLPDIAGFRLKFNDFLARFGHLSDSGNDFSAFPWREKPEVMLNLVTQPAAGGETVRSLESFSQYRLLGLSKAWGRLFYQRARRFRLYREQVSSLYTFAYGLFRPYTLALGSHFAARDLLDEAADIFYLEREEIRAAVATSDPSALGLAGLASQRKKEMARCQDVLLPTLIYGEVAPLVDQVAVEKLTGVATSRGYYAGPVRVVNGLDDFGKVQEGDVLVIPYSDVGWAPLFARAGAVIAESGGILSHSSIIAREYQIPAVVSVAEAMLLQDGRMVSVDGFRGEIILHR
jgi:phosphohistidine swiveling domain-containing protein